MEKKTFYRVKKTMEETSGRPTEEDPSSRTARHAIDVACTEKCNKSQFTSYINRESDTSYI